MYEVYQKTLASALGISARQIRNLKEQGMFAFIPGTKKYNLTAAVKEFVEYKVKAEIGEGTSVVKEKEQAEHERLKKEITKLKLRRLKGETHEAADVEEFLNGMLQNFRNRLLAVPAKIAPLILGETDINVIINELTNEMLETLEELSEYDPDKINGDQSALYSEEEDENEDEEDAPL